MKEYGIRLLEPSFIPYMGCSFLLNEGENGWNCNIFIFQCMHRSKDIDPLDEDDWYGFIPNQLKQHKFKDGSPNINS